MLMPNLLERVLRRAEREFTEEDLRERTAAIAEKAVAEDAGSAEVGELIAQFKEADARVSAAQHALDSAKQHRNRAHLALNERRRLLTQSVQQCDAKIASLAPRQQIDALRAEIAERQRVHETAQPMLPVPQWSTIGNAGFFRNTEDPASKAAHDKFCKWELAGAELRGIEARARGLELADDLNAEVASIRAALRKVR